MGACDRAPVLRGRTKCCDRATPDKGGDVVQKPTTPRTHCLARRISLPYPGRWAATNCAGCPRRPPHAGAHRQGVSDPGLRGLGVAGFSDRPAMVAVRRRATPSLMRHVDVAGAPHGPYYWKRDPHRFSKAFLSPAWGASRLTRSIFYLCANESSPEVRLSARRDRQGSRRPA